MTHISIQLFRALLFSFLVCGALAYVLIILYDSQEIDDNIKDHVETEFVSDGNVSETHKPTNADRVKNLNVVEKLSQLFITHTVVIN